MCPKSPIYRPLMTIQKSLEQMWLLGVIFWRVVTLGSYFLNFWILDLDQTWEALIFGIIKIMYTYIHILPLFDDDNQVISFRHHQNIHYSHSPLFWWWHSLSSKFFFTSSKPAWFTFSPFFMITTTCRLGATTTKKSICI